MTKKPLAGQRALVTGASRGIGRAIALRLARDGADIVLNYARDEAGAQATALEIEQTGRICAMVPADVADRDAVENAAASFNALGPVDIIVNNAGTASYGALLTQDETEFDRVLGVNLKGPLNIARVIAPSMISRKSGRIINISSVAALGTAAPGIGLYSISKAALNMATKQLALELAPHGINVNAICPGPTATAALAEGASKIGVGGAAQTQINLLNRVADPDEIASTAAFLAGPDSSFVTAQVFAVDGGVLRFLSRSG